MVKKLWLLRHGQAGHQAGQSDFDRDLTEMGKDTVMQLGKEMTAREFYPDLVVCGASRRTRQTATYFLKELPRHGKVVYLDQIYEASLATLLQVVNDTDKSINNLLMIGHNPGISYIFDYLTGQTLGNLRPGELVELTFADLEWSEISKGSGTAK